MILSAKKIPSKGKSAHAARPDQLLPLNKFLMLIGIAGLLSASGCVFEGNREHARDQAHGDIGTGRADSGGVDHGEFPGDMDHNQDP